MHIKNTTNHARALKWENHAAILTSQAHSAEAHGQHDSAREYRRKATEAREIANEIWRDGAQRRF